MSPDLLNRRKLLKLLAAAPASVPLSLRAEAETAGLIATEVCMVQPEMTEGPFYLDAALIRQDITEGRPGLPVALRLQVVDADCTPIPGARVDVWHCDAAGVYSGVEGEGGTFLRGSQPTGPDGVCAFRTVFPGWYPGRVVHIHYKVFLPGDQEILTSQLFFDDALAEQIYLTHPHYRDRGPQDRTRLSDRIARRAGNGAMASALASESAGEIEAALVVGVDRSA